MLITLNSRYLNVTYALVSIISPHCYHATSRLQVFLDQYLVTILGEDWRVLVTPNTDDGFSFTALSRRCSQIVRHNFHLFYNKRFLRCDTQLT